MYSVDIQRQCLNQSVVFVREIASLTLADGPVVAPSCKDFSDTLAGNRFGTLQHMVFMADKLNGCSDAEKINIINAWKSNQFLRKWLLMKCQIHHLYHANEYAWTSVIRFLSINNVSGLDLMPLHYSFVSRSKTFPLIIFFLCLRLKTPWLTIWHITVKIQHGRDCEP